MSKERSGSPATNEKREAALAAFMEWFRTNYPGPDTIISRPDWHAPKVFRAVEYALKDAGLIASETAATVQRELPGQERTAASVWRPAYTEESIPSAERVTAALHACEGLDTADLAGNEKGWLAGLVHDVHRVERELNHALKARCPGNGDGDDCIVECQLYEASEQRDPCPPGCCSMADATDVRALMDAIERDEDEPSGTPSSAAYTKPRNVDDIIALIKEAIDYHDVSDAEADAMDVPASAAYHAQQAKALRMLLEPSAPLSASEPPSGYKLVCEKCGADKGDKCGWPSNCPTGAAADRTANAKEKS